MVTRLELSRILKFHFQTAQKSIILGGGVCGTNLNVLSLKFLGKEAVPQYSFGQHETSVGDFFVFSTFFLEMS